MKTKRKIFIAFILNLLFSIFELFGGFFTGSVAIASDAIHDFGDAISIGTAYCLEKVSEKNANVKYPYGYVRFSVLGGLITTVILLISSVIVVYNAIMRFIIPVQINYDGMLIFAVVGLVVNIIATHFTHGGKSINQKAVNLHMLEDALGWLVVLFGAIVMKFTNFHVIDPILSLIVSLFMIINCIINLKQVLDIFLIKTPKNIDTNKLLENIKNIDGIISVNNIRVWSLDGVNNCATINVLVKEIDNEIKVKIREKVQENNIIKITIEMDTSIEDCNNNSINIKNKEVHCHHHHK